MSLDTDERQRALRVWNAFGSLALGQDSGQAYDFHVSNQAGQFSIDTRPVVAIPSPVVATVGGYAITLPVLLLIGAAAYLVLKK